MYRKHTLKPSVWHAEELEFELDTDLGILRGRDAERVQELVDLVLVSGSVSIHPLPATYDVKDPLHNLTEMAAILGYRWHLDDELQAAYPKIQEGDDTVYEIDADGTKRVARFQPLT